MLQDYFNALQLLSEADDFHGASAFWADEWGNLVYLLN